MSARAASRPCMIWPFISRPDAEATLIRLFRTRANRTSLGGTRSAPNGTRFMNLKRPQLLLRDACGAAIPEYALILAVVVGGAVIGISTLAQLTAGRALAQLTEVEEQGATSADVASDPAPGVSEVARAYHSSNTLLAAQIGMLLVLQTLLVVNRTRRKQEPEEPETEARFSRQVQHCLSAKRQQIYHIIEKNMDLLLDSQIQVWKLMSPKVTCVLPSTPAAEVAEMMDSHKIRHLLVCNGKNELVGIISDRDLNRRGVKTAEQLMTRDPVTVRPNMLVSPAITMMMKLRISCLPVTKNNELVGVLTSTDLMMALQCALQVLQNVAGEVIGRRPSPAEALAEACESVAPEGEPLAV